VHNDRANTLIAATFIFQNILAAGTAILIAQYSVKAARKLQDISPLTAQIAPEDASILMPLALRDPPIPGNLGWWTGSRTLSATSYLLGFGCRSAGDL
jgi:hypothetical protein